MFKFKKGEHPKYICPVCGYDQLEFPPYDDEGIPSYGICSSCGFEYGYDDNDCGFTFDSYRDKWIKDGCPWFSKRSKPKNWDLQTQLDNIQKQ